MKHLFFYFLMSLAIAPKLGAQDSTQVAEPNFIPVLTYWNLNDTFSYKVQKTDVKYAEDGTVKDSTGQEYFIQLVVVDSTDTTYVIRVHRTFNVDDLAMAMEKIKLSQSELVEMCRLMGSEYLEYVISQNGEYLETKNAENLSKGLAFMLQKAFASLDTFSDQRSKNMQAFGAKFASSELAQTKMMEDFILMHKFYGVQLAQDSIVEFDQEIQSPFAPDKTMIYHNQVKATIPEDWGGWFRIQNYITVDSISFKGFLDGFFSEMKLEESVPGSQKGVTDLSPSVKIYLSYAIDPDWGKVESMYMEKTIYMDNKRARQQTTLIEGED